MSSVAAFIVETYQGSYVPVIAGVVRIDEVEDCLLEPLSFAVPFVMLDQAQEFVTEQAPLSALIYTNPIKMNPTGIKWLSEVEAVQ